MADRVTESTLKLTADPAGLTRVYDLVDKIAKRATEAQGAVSGVGRGVGRGGGPRLPTEDGGSGQPKIEHGSPEWFRTLLTGGRGARGAAAVGATGLAGYMLGHSVMAAGGAISTLYGADAPLAAGMYSGNAFQAASAMSQYRATRQVAGYQGISAGVGALAGAGSLAGGAMLMGGAGAAGVAGAAGAANAWNPVGWGLIAGAALLQIANKWGESAAIAEVSTRTAKEQAAISRLESVTGKRTALSMSILGGMPYGANLGAEELGRLGNTYGLSAANMQDRATAFRRAGGGTGLDVAQIRELELGLGIGAEQSGRFFKSFRPGMGATSTQGAQTNLETLFAVGMASGLDESRLPELMDRAASYLQAMGEQGIQIRAESLTQLASDLQAVGLQGMQGMRAAEGMRSFGQGMLGSLTNSMAPRELVEGLVASRIYGQKGGPAAWTKTMEDPEAMSRIFSDVIRSSPEVMRPFLASQISGLAPGAAGKLGNWRPGSTTPAVDDLGISGRAARVLGSDEMVAVRAQATRDNAETLALTIEQLVPAFDALLKFLQASLANMQATGPDAVRAASRALDGEPHYMPRGSVEVASWNQSRVEVGGRGLGGRR